MKKISMFMVLSAALLGCGMTACNREDALLPEESQTEIRLSTGIQVQTRAAFPETDKQVSWGETVHVWVDQVGSETTPLYENNTLTANGDGTLSADTWLGGSKMYFPLNGNPVNIYALHTTATWTGNTYPTATMTHSVKDVQKTLYDYASSDLLYGRALNVARTKEAVPLTFYHLLSKVQIAICPVDGLSASDIQRVTLDGTKLMANLTLGKSTSPLALDVTPAGSATSIEIGTDVSADFTEEGLKYNDVIVVPQTLSAGTAFLTVTMASGEEIVYRLTSDARFESGKKYCCHMSVSMNEIQLKTSVSDWKPGDLLTGNNGTVHYEVKYTDNTSETVYSETMGTVAFKGTGKTVRSIDLPDLGKSYLIGRSNLTSLTLALDDNGDLGFRPSVDGYTPIGSYAELQLINTFPGAMAGHYRQEADLDLMSEEWTPIGDGTTTKFSGKYDGANFKIDRLKIEKATGYNAGLFGYIDGTYAEISNVNIASGTIAATKGQAGGICGYNNGGSINHCSNAAQVADKNESSSSRVYSYSGGISGYNNNGHITACYNTGTISSYVSHGTYTYSYSGGIAGYNYNACTVTACYNIGAISSYATDDFASSGGIAGYNYNLCTITACYNIGTISATAAKNANAGGIVGHNNSGCTVTACYWKSGTGMPSQGIGSDSGTSVDVISFTDSFTPDATTYPQWELGNGSTNGWWKNYNGNNNLPQLWWEK